jgi:putative PEP-CTERM system TPR-repeat lipoprotein
MRYRSLGWIVLGAWLGIWPVAAHADYMSNARASLKKGDLKSAQIDLRNAVRSDPQNAEAHFLLGRVAIELGDPVAAEREASAALDRGYDAHQAAPLLAQALLSQNKNNELLEKLKPAGKDGALDAAILVARGYAQIALHLPEDAQKSFADAEAAAPNAVEPLLADARLSVARNDLAGAQEKIDRAVNAQPKSAEALLAKSQLLRLKGDGAGGMAVLDALIADQPSITQAHLDRADLALAMNKPAVARSDIDIVLKGSKGNIQALYLDAVIKAQAKDYKAADDGLQRIQAYLGRIPRGYFLRAVVKEQLGQYEEAEDAARKYLATAPNDLAAYKVLARILFVKHRPDQVVETLAKVTESGKADAESYDLLGRAYAATNRPADAIVNFQRAEALAPNDVGLQTRLAAVRMGQGDVEAAVGDLEHTLELAPKVPVVGETLFFAAIATGDLDKTAAVLEKIKVAEGDTDVVRNLEGLFAMAKLDLPGAEKIFRDEITKSPEFTPAQINLARVLAMTGRQEEAEKLLKDIVTKQPTAEPALSMLASTYAQSSRIEQALNLLDNAHRSDPKNVRITTSLGDLYIRSGAPQKALDLVGSEPAASATTTEMLSLRAAAQLALGQKKDARDTYSDLLKKDPSVVGARRQLVALLIEAGDFESGRALLSAGIVASPRNYQLYQDLAMIDLRSTGIEAALATADRLASQDRDFSLIRALKGDIFMAANRAQDAINAYKDAMTAAPSSILATRLAAADLRAQQPDDAIKTLGDWLATNPTDVSVLEQLSEIEISQNKLPEAKDYLETILKLKPHQAVALNNLAWVYQQLGDARAMDLARQAYVLAPGAQTADTLGWILTSAGNAGTGSALLRQASAEAENDPRVQYHFAVALKDTGKKDEAIKRLTKVVETKGEFKEKAMAQQLLDELKKGS